MLAIQTVPVAGNVIDLIYSQKVVNLTICNPPVNSYVLFQDAINSKHAVLARYLGCFKWQRVKPDRQMNISGFKPRDSAQSALVDCLTDDNILINVAIGSAGTGKTTLAMATAAHDWINSGRRILLSKPTAIVGTGQAFGPVPGTIEEKYDPYLASYKIVLDKVFGTDKSYIDRMVSKGDIEFQPVELARGCTFENATFILDEAQNMTWHELNTIISRMGENTKMIILGDLKQIDIPLSAEETGLYKLVYSIPFQESDIASAVQLKNQYRSPITALVAEVNEWVTQEKSTKKFIATPPPA